MCHIYCTASAINFVSFVVVLIMLPLIYFYSQLHFKASKSINVYKKNCLLIGQIKIGQEVSLRDE